ncbi:MAG TPA: hypothetical protein VGM90_18835 [Kofleriaceae bacterium]
MARFVRRLTAPIALASALGIAPACALTLDGPRPERLISERPVCDTSKGLVGADGVVGGLLGISAIGVADSSTGAAIVMGLVATAFVASAVHGNGVVDECNDASSAWNHDYASGRLNVPDQRVANGALRMRQRPPVEGPPVMRPPVVRQQPPIMVAPPPAPVTVEPPPEPEQSSPPPQVVKQPVQVPAKAKDTGEWSSFWEETP